MNEYSVNAHDLISVADAIRTKGATTKTLVFPDEFVTAIQNIQGGVELNFEVIGGTTQPENPKENTIWINTDQEITGWSISPSRPVNPLDCTVYISNNPQIGISINALMENEITVHPFSSMQYINGAWVDKELLIYKNGSWIKSWNGILFDGGNAYENLTGGWVDAARIAPSYTSRIPIIVNNVITLNSTDTSGYRQSIAMTANKIDTSGFSAVEIDVTYHGITGDGGGYERYIYLTTSNENDWYTSYASIKSFGSTGTYSCPISTPGKYYIAIGIVTTDHRGHVNVQIPRVRLVK